MRALLERYVRSLLEQEQARDAPEYRQDLGTFVDWLLRRQGFRVVERTFRHDGAARRGARGERQWGADILAIKTDKDGASHGYRFVLKQGSIGSSQWRMEDGYLPHDLVLAVQRRDDDLRRYDPYREISSWTVVAVHNGDFRADQVGDQRYTLMTSLPLTAKGVNIEWWDVDRLVELALDTTTGWGSLEERADPDLFPPGVRPFARLAIDSLNHGADGQRFDIEAVDRLIDAVLPKSEVIGQARWDRGVSELGLFVAMVAAESRRLTNVRSSTLPALDASERIICRAIHHVTGWAKEEASKEQRRAVELLRLLLMQYVGLASDLRRHLSNVLRIERGLSLGSISERVDYPMRSLRLATYLAIACQAALDINDRSQADSFAEDLFLLAKNNPGGLLSPVIDDQVTELAIIWDAWIRIGQAEWAFATARGTAMRLYAKKKMGMPLPALGLSAEFPPDSAAMKMLVDAYLNFDERPASLEDRGSQIWPLALYLGWKNADSSEADLAYSQMMLNVTDTDGPHESGLEEDVSARTIFMQSWLPPNDAAKSWYTERLANRGITHVFQLGGLSMRRSFSDFLAEFENFNRELPFQSLATRLNLPSIDRIAWRQYRNPPPLAIFKNV